VRRAPSVATRTRLGRVGSADRERFGVGQAQPIVRRSSRGPPPRQEHKVLNHFASPRFWFLFRQMPAEIQRLAEDNYRLLVANPRHPSLRLKRVGSYWSVRIGLHYRALGTDVESGILWGWIGSHAEYDAIIG